MAQGSGGFGGGLSQGLASLPSGIAAGFAQRQRQENQDRLDQIESRKAMGEAVKQLNEIVNSVDDAQMPVALDLFMNQVEGITGKKIPKEFRAGIKSDPQNFTGMLTNTFIDNKNLTAENFGAAMDPQAMLGMMVAFGAKKKGLEAKKQLQLTASQAVSGSTIEQAPNPAYSADQDNPASAQPPTVAVTKPGPALTPENTAGLTAKRDRIEQLLANPDLPKEMRTSMEKILGDTNAALGTSVDDKSLTLQIGRELKLNPAIPEHQALISIEVQRRRVAEANAAETGKQNAQPLDLTTARELRISPLLNRGEARGLKGAGQARLPSAAQLEGEKEAARVDAQPIDLSLARDTGISPIQTRKEVRRAFGAEGLALPSAAEQTALGEDAKRTVDTFKEYGQLAMGANNRGPIRQQIRALLPFASTGMGAGQRMQLDRAASAIGIDAKGLAPLQVMDMLTKKLSIESAAAMKGSLSDRDREFAIASEPNILQAKNSIAVKMAFDDITDKRVTDRAAAIPKYNRTCGITGAKCGGKSFDEVWGEFAEKNSLQPKYEAVLRTHGIAVPALPDKKAGAVPVPPPSPAAPVAPLMTPQQMQGIEGTGSGSFGLRKFKNR